MGSNNIEPKYWAQAMTGLREYTPGQNPINVYRIAEGEIHVLLDNMRSMTSSPVALEARGDINEFAVYEHDTHLANVRCVGSTLHVDSSPARRSKIGHHEAIFYQRFWSALAAYTSACDA